ncbi:phage minor structural protein [Bacillus sp. AG1163]|uniref:phage tail spike protein n=1 Tax=Bacillus sp. AG1163 TaxID=2183999 RepID=UPI0010660BCD|nr:phage tail spike protein [Bacillus sp. AG1163]TDT83165.1 phage minor structural protein [Bacillus sp. AG1163]
MLKLYNKQLRLKAYLENAFKISYEQQFNSIWTAAFSLPLNDLKDKEITAFDFLELFDNGKRIGMFRILPKETVKNENTKTVTYKCEHVLATLLSDVLFRYHQLSNYTTRQVLEYLLSQQETKHWRLGKCDFVRYFHYSWEHENTILGPVLSVPKPFDEPHAWTWDDSIENYPWTLNLEKASNEITGDLRFKKNLKGITKTEDPTDIITRIYPMGYGEGVNQLDISKVNPTRKPYIEAPQHIIDKYGIHKYIWVDKRFENVDTLFSSGQALLNKRSRPKLTYSVNAIDYELIDPYKLEKYEYGKLVRITDEELGIEVDVRLMKKGKSDVTGNPLNMSLEIGDPIEDLGTTQADLERRQKINETYSQGATNIDSHDYNDNCDPENPAVIKFFLPEDLVNINSLILTYEIEEFRAYSKATKGGGAIVESTSAGGAVVNSTSAGGGVVNSTSSGGGSTQTSSSGGGSTQTSTSGGGGSFTSEAGGGAVPSTTQKSFAEMHLMSGVPQNSVGSENWGYHLHEVVIPGDAFSHSHTVNVPSHKHQVNIPAHSHSVTIPAHTHSVQIPDHTHQINIPNHTHEINIPNHTHTISLPDHMHDIQHGIYKLSEKPSRVTVKVDGNIVPVDSTSAQNINLIPYLSKDGGGKIERNKWHTVTITPDKLGRVNANIISRLFIQSRIGGTF